MVQMWLDALHVLQDGLPSNTSVREALEFVPLTSAQGRAAAAARAALAQYVDGVCCPHMRMERMVECMVAALRVPVLAAVPCALALPESSVGLLAALVHGHSSGVLDDAIHICVTEFWDVFAPHVDEWLETLKDDPAATTASTAFLFHLLMATCSGKIAPNTAQKLCVGLSLATEDPGGLLWQSELATFKAPRLRGQPAHMQQQLVELLTIPSNKEVQAAVLQLMCRWTSSFDDFLRETSQAIVVTVADALVTPGSTCSGIQEAIIACTPSIVADERMIPGMAPYVNLLVGAAAISCPHSEQLRLLAAICSGATSHPSQTVRPACNNSESHAAPFLGESDVSTGASSLQQLLQSVLCCLVLRQPAPFADAIQQMLLHCSSQVRSFLRHLPRMCVFGSPGTPTGMPTTCSVPTAFEQMHKPHGSHPKAQMNSVARTKFTAACPGMQHRSLPAVQ
jgi:hypothetical protein